MNRCNLFGHRWFSYLSWSGERLFRCNVCGSFFGWSPHQFRLLWLVILLIFALLFTTRASGQAIFFDQDDQEFALEILDMDNDCDIDLRDWALWERSFKEPAAEIAAPLEHCTDLSKQIVRVYRPQNMCEEPINPGDQLWFMIWPWNFQWSKWYQFQTGPM